MKANFFSLFSVKSAFEKKLYRIIGFYPNNKHLYQQAFLHKSVVTHKNSSYESNERLEFLGDTVLDLVISEYLFKKFPYKDEGFLTKTRSKLVSRKTLNKLAIKIGLEDMIQSKVNSASKAIYGDALEALIGAIYIDKGYKYANSFIIEKLVRLHLNIEELMNTENDYKSKIIEWGQKEKIEILFKAEEIEKNNERLFIVTLVVNNIPETKATAHTKKQAEQKAAELFYQKLI